jgi:hypothetical protein
VLNPSFTYVGLVKADQDRISQLLARSILLVNNAYWGLSLNAREAVDGVKAVTLVTDQEFIGDLGNGAIRFTVAYLTGGSDAWTGSLFAHEGQHMLNHGRPVFAGATLWRDEQMASRTQFEVGMKIGFTPAEAAWLTKWSADSNEAAMQAHMTGGMKLNDLVPLCAYQR